MYLHINKLSLLLVALSLHMLFFSRAHGQSSKEGATTKSGTESKTASGETAGESVSGSGGPPAGSCYQAPIQWANPSSNVNYILSRTFREAMTDANQAVYARDIHQEVSYMDGLGRPFQSHKIQASPSLKDQVEFVAYDDLGRKPKQYMPFGITGNNGSYISNPLTVQQNFYNFEFPTYASQALFAETDFEASPLNRVLEQGAVGDAWQIDRVGGVSTKQGNTVQLNIRSNYYDPADPTTNIDQVIWWQYSPLVDKFSATGFYANNELIVKESIDENKSRVLEYTDKLGRPVLKRTELNQNSTDTNPDTWASVYYLYDIKSNLRHVIQPEGLLKLHTNGYNLNDPDVANEFLFSFIYDDKKRVVEKKAPGSAWQYVVYDNLNRVVLFQDGNLRVNGEWEATKFGTNGQIILTGIYQPGNNPSRVSLQAIMDGGQYEYNEERAQVGNLDKTGQVILGYTNQAFPPIGDMTVHAISMYNDHDFIFDGSSNPGFIPDPTLNATANDRTQGMLTGVKLRILGSNDWHWTVNFYDQYGTKIQTQSKHDYGTDVMTQELNFAGEVLATRQIHTGPQGAFAEVKRYCYDHAGRPLRTTHQIDQQEEIVMETFDYDEMGRMIERNIHSEDDGASFLQSVDYSYNIRNWQTAINQLDPNGPQLQAGEDVIDLFAMEFSYESDPLSGSGSSVTVNPTFDGKIAAIQWQDAFESNMHLYAYQYDKRDRLTSASYAAFDNGASDWVKNQGRYNTSYSYDQQGNILSLQRFGKTGTSSYGLLDNLTYSYKNGESNQLLTVSDAANAPAGSAIDQFLDGNTTGNDYEYDANGNVIADKNKGIIISYNHFDKPILITNTSTGSQITYVYNGAGVKIRQIVNNGTTKTRDYIYGAEYVDLNLVFLSTGTGRAIRETNGNFYYEYFHTDHLGNVRLSFADLNNDGDINPNTEVTQTDHYYPFGMRMSFNMNPQSSVAQRYLFNGKELETDLGVNWADFGARMYDASIGRWNAIDPVAMAYQFFSPYTAMINDPINQIDPDGRSVVSTNGGGTIIFDLSKIEGDGVVYFMNNGEFVGGGEVYVDEKKKEVTYESRLRFEFYTPAYSEKIRNIPLNFNSGMNPYPTHYIIHHEEEVKEYINFDVSWRFDKGSCSWEIVDVLATATEGHHAPFEIIWDAKTIDIKIIASTSTVTSATEERREEIKIGASGSAGTPDKTTIGKVGVSAKIHGSAEMGWKSTYSVTHKIELTARRLFRFQFEAFSITNESVNPGLKESQGFLATMKKGETLISAYGNQNQGAPDTVRDDIIKALGPTISFRWVHIHP